MAWEHPHGDSANRSFADVDTAPAGAGSISVPNLGTFAPGSGPVIAPDGTVYLGTTEGRLIALRVDGSELWAAELPEPQGIVSSAVVGADGSIYVVAVALPIRVRDHREGARFLVLVEYRAWLHKFAPSGQRLWDIPFPDKRHPLLPSYGPRLTGPPNILRSGGQEYVMVPAVYRSFGREFYVVAFPAQGGTPVDARVSFIPDEIAGSGFSWWEPDWWPFQFFPGGDPDYAPHPGLPPVAIYTYPTASSPFVMATDRIHDVVGLTFDPQRGFLERFRVRDANRVMLSAPSVLPDAHSAVGTDTGEVVFVGPNQTQLAPVNVAGGRHDRIYAPLTRTADATFAVAASRLHGLALLRSNVVVHRFAPRDIGYVVVPAAASRTNVFASTSTDLITFNSDLRAELRRFPWVGGGVSIPVIGPSGRVYAIASNILFIFPPPRQRPRPEGPIGGDEPPPADPGRAAEPDAADEPAQSETGDD